MNIRELLEKRHMMKGISFSGEEHLSNNLLGRHDIHVGDDVQLKIDGKTLMVTVKGSANEHFVGELISANCRSTEIANLLNKTKLITFDEFNIFECHDRHAS